MITQKIAKLASKAERVRVAYDERSDVTGPQIVGWEHNEFDVIGAQPVSPELVMDVIRVRLVVREDSHRLVALQRSSELEHRALVLEGIARGVAVVRPGEPGALVLFEVRRHAPACSMG